jgi:hypothetical protein
MAEEYKTYVASEMLTPEGKDDLTTGEIEALGTFLAVNVVGGAWATMDEWGTGSEMSLENPALEGYRDSKYWNPRRHDTTIRGRPKGQYTNIFGETKTSSGGMAGLDLEYLSNIGELPFDIRVQPPSHAMETAARWMRETRVQTIWRESLQAFHWGGFFVITQD